MSQTPTKKTPLYNFPEWKMAWDNAWDNAWNNAWDNAWNNSMPEISGRRSQSTVTIQADREALKKKLRKISAASTIVVSATQESVAEGSWTLTRVLKTA